jgi:hypothetical protein
MPSPMANTSITWQATSMSNQLYYTPNTNTWADQDLTAFANGSLAASGSGLSGYAITDGQHVYYRTL